MTAWKVGRATITPIVEVESVTSPRFLFTGVDKASVLDMAHRAPWLQGTFVDDGGYLLQRIQCLVIDIDGIRVAVDTCVGNDKPRANPGWHGLDLPFLTDLEAAGFPPDSIDAVVCTHLHVDHIGWNTMLVEGRWVPTFPNARYLLAQPEFEYWQVTPDASGDELFGDSVAPVHAAGLVDLVPVDHVVDGNIRFDSTPGHTPGHVSVVIESAGERAVITGDMIHTPIQIADVARSSAFDFDQQAAADTRARFLEQYADGTLVIGTHWGGPGAGRIVADDGAWAVDPIAAS
ncbi:MAG TPA: MBL fold metallo-hydrolase [Acidimicrobiales bacterium]|nr:MBL fold metallo-hydrolase [Acidimicrobiales bacterium]